MASVLQQARRNVDELSLLLEISELLDRSTDIRDELGPVLRLLARRTGMLRGTIALLNRERSEVVICAAHGLTPEQLERGRYQLGEGVIGRVVQEGHPVIIPRIAEDPRFLNRTQARSMSREDVSYLCVPIKLESVVVGALSADRLFDQSVSLEEDLRLLQIIASLIARAVRLRQRSQEEYEQLVRDNMLLQQELRRKFQPANMIGRSKAMQAVYDHIIQVAPTDATVLIRGESGVGKELVAQSIHYNSDRAGKPFIRVNCAALPEHIGESELFGHEKGAF
ncbi:MAG TPA: sigma 54-interacting transcriptional regulator, partial [Candidatus Hydrogenedentes bacterium]|nr:sigma 54-interacting transcriptional regulator [Candidatus Hydrogenedentota bacterium]